MNRHDGAAEAKTRRTQGVWVQIQLTPYRATDSQADQALPHLVETHAGAQQWGDLLVDERKSLGKDYIKFVTPKIPFHDGHVGEAREAVKHFVHFQ
jgi:hypothetical protein